MELDFTDYLRHTRYTTISTFLNQKVSWESIFPHLAHEEGGYYGICFISRDDTLVLESIDILSSCASSVYTSNKEGTLRIYFFFYKGNKSAKNVPRNKILDALWGKDKPLYKNKYPFYATIEDYILDGSRECDPTLGLLQSLRRLGVHKELIYKLNKIGNIGGTDLLGNSYTVSGLGNGKLLSSSYPNRPMDFDKSWDESLFGDKSSIINKNRKLDIKVGDTGVDGERYSINNSNSNQQINTKTNSNNSNPYRNTRVFYTNNITLVRIALESSKSVILADSLFKGCKYIEVYKLKEGYMISNMNNTIVKKREFEGALIKFLEAGSFMLEDKLAINHCMYMYAL